MELTTLNRENEKQWDDFVLSQEGASIFFSLDWRQIIKKVFGYDDRYYLITENNQVKAIFPLFVVDSCLWDSRILSIPFADSGGIYYSSSLDLAEKERIEKIFLDQVRELAVRKRIKIIEMRGYGFPYISNKNGLILTEPYCHFTLGRGDLSSYRHHNKLSRNIKRMLKASKGNIEIGECLDLSQIRSVYDCYVYNTKKLSSPVLPQGYFEEQWSRLSPKNMLKIFMARAPDSDRILGAITLLVFKRSVYAEHLFSMTDQPYLSIKVNLYHHSILWACENNMEEYDFSRTRKGSGVYEHKQRWGGREIPIAYSYLSLGTKRISPIDYDNRQYLFPKLFLRHSPLAVFKKISPAIRKQAGK